VGILICTDKGPDCFLITDRLQQFSWLSMPFCTSLSSRVQYFFPVLFHINTHILISEFICVGFCVCMDYLGCYQHLVKISCQCPSEIYLLRKMVTCSILILPAVDLIQINSVARNL